MSTPTRRAFNAEIEVVAAFHSVRADRVHGAQALAEEALRALGRLLARWQRRSELPSPAVLAPVIGRVLEEAQPAMGPFVRWSVEWRRMDRSGPRARWFRTARAWVRREQTRIRSESSGLARTCRQRFPASAREVVTISRSRSVLGALVALPENLRPVRITVLESLPGGEGRQFAADLRKVGFSTRTIADRRGPDAVRAADLVVIGADAVSADRSVVHKVGTRALAQTAARCGTPVVVVAGRSKFTGRPAPRAPLPVGFDRTPARWISEFWTDTGLLRGGRMRPRRPGGPPH